MTLETLRAEQREVILRLAEAHGASNVRVFGSVARRTSGPQSDLDLLVDLAPDRTLFDLGGLQVELEETIGVAVDVATPDLLTAGVRETALRDAVLL